MPQTEAIGYRLDGARKVFHGTTATLALLDFARPGRKGYDALIDVPNFWHLHSGKEIGEAMILEIVETATITRELIDKAVGFGIFIPGISEPEKAWVLTGDDPRKAPTMGNKRAWSFIVVPTGEVVNR